MRLEDKLQELRSATEAQVPEGVLKLMHQATQELEESGLAQRILGVGEKLPSFSMPNQFGELLHSAELLEYGPLVLTVYRGFW